jgi:hypothetical protein
MRLQIYVPKRATEAWQPEPTLTFQHFLSRLAYAAGGITVTQGTSHWYAGKSGMQAESMLIVEVLPSQPEDHEDARRLLREYAEQLIADGEESVLIVEDNEPTYIE